jgi:hypothetical protein
MKLSELPKHHAILLTHGRRALYADEVWKELSSLSPAHRYFQQTVLDIETSRAIISWAQAPYNDERVALITFHTAGLPAQNALLKILEEPREGTRFIIVTTHKKNLIDTVISRMHHMDMAEETESDAAREFLKAEPQARMKLPSVVSMLMQTDEEGRKDREAVKGFILSLAGTLGKTKSDPRYVKEAIEAASYASDPSASGKALIEYLSLLLPIIK